MRLSKLFWYAMALAIGIVGADIMAILWPTNPGYSFLTGVAFFAWMVDILEGRT